MVLFGSEGESFPDLVGMENCMSHCTSAEALADFAMLITTMKAELNAETSPVVAFGGSYGGMLSSWFRIKYPNIIDVDNDTAAPRLEPRGQLAPSCPPLPEVRSVSAVWTRTASTALPPRCQRETAAA